MRKLWRLGFQASQRGGRHRRRRGAVRPAPSAGWRSAVVDRRRRRSTATSPTRACAILNGADLAARADVVVVAAHDGFGYERAARARSRPCCAAPRSWRAGRDATFPMPDGPWPGTGPVVAALEAADRRHGAQHRQARAGALPHGPGPPRARAARSSSATASTPTSQGARAAGLDGAVVLTGATTAAAAAAAEPAPALVAATLAELVLRVGPGAGLRRWRAAWTGPSASSSTPTPAAAARCARCRRSRRACATSASPCAPTQHARPRPRPGAGRRGRRRGRAARRLSGDGLIGAVAGALRDRPGAMLGILPGGRGNDFARMLGLPLEPGRGVRRAGRRRLRDRRRRPGRRPAVHRDRQPRLRLRRQPDRQRGAVAPRDARLRLRRAARPGRLAAPRPSPRRRRDVRTFAGWSRGRRELQGLRRRHVRRARRPSSTTARSTSSCRRRTSKRGFLRRCCRASSRARTSTSRRSTSCAAPRSGSPPTGRSWSTPTATRSRELPVTLTRRCPTALQVLVPA